MNIKEYFNNNDESLCFVTYDKNNEQQNKFLNEIAYDDAVIEFLNNITYSITSSSEDNSYSKGFLVKDVKTDEYVGICTLSAPHYEEDVIAVEAAIHKNFRSSSRNYGSKILKILTKSMLINPNISKLVLEISRNNIASIKAAIKAGFEVDHALVEKFQKEDYRNIPYSFCNRNYTPSNNISSSCKR